MVSLKNYFFSMSSVCLCFLIFSCGARLSEKIGEVVPATLPPVQSSVFKTKAVLKTTQDEDFQLLEVTTKPRILLFATTYCGICQKEHRELRDLMAQHSGHRPDNVELYTIMTDSTDNSDATDFKDFTQIQWDPLYQVGDELRSQVCGHGTDNPCVVIELPDKGVVFQHIGAVSIEQMQTLTGAWTWAN